MRKPSLFPVLFRNDSPVRFTIRAFDPRFNGSDNDVDVAYIDFIVTNSPVLGPALDAVLKIFGMRVIESLVSWGNAQAIPFIIFPSLLTVSFGVGWWAVEYVTPMRERPDARAVTAVVMFS